MAFVKIPRAVLYMKWWEALGSLFKLPFIKASGQCKVPLLEKKFADTYGTNHAIAMPNGRLSLYFSLQALDLKQGDEVIMTPITIPDMLNMVHLLGLRPVFVDINLEDYGPDFSDLEKLVNEKSKVLFITNLCGIVPDMERIANFAREHDLVLIQDITQAHLSSFKGKNISDFADISFFSLCNLKDIHTHAGGMILTSNDRYFKKMNNLRVLNLKPQTKRNLLRYIFEDVIATIATIPIIFSLTLYYVFYFFTPKVIEDITNGSGIKLDFWWNPFRKMSLFKGLFGGAEIFLRDDIPQNMLHRMCSFQAKAGIKQFDRINKIINKRNLITKKIYDNLSAHAKEYVSPKVTAHGNSNWRFAVLPEKVEEFQRSLMAMGFDNAKTNLIVLPDCIEFSIYSRQTPNAKYFKEHAVFIPNHYYLNEKQALLLSKAIGKSLGASKLKNNRMNKENTLSKNCS